MDYLYKAKKCIQREITFLSTKEGVEKEKETLEQYGKTLELAYELRGKVNEDVYAPVKQVCNFNLETMEHNITEISVSYQDMVALAQNMGNYPSPHLHKAAKLVRYALKYDVGAWLAFPAKTVEEVNDKFKGCYIPREPGICDVHVEKVLPRIETGGTQILAFNLPRQRWSGDERKIYITRAYRIPFTYDQWNEVKADLTTQLTKDNALVNIDEVQCYTVERSDIDNESELAVEMGIPTTEELVMYVDRMFALVLKPARAPILWAFEEYNLPCHKVSVVPYEKIKDKREYYCCRPQFNINCNEVPYCCGECPMLEYIIYNILEVALDKESNARLWKTLKDAGMVFDGLMDENNNPTCNIKCPKADGCCTSKHAVNEVYRHYYAVVEHMQKNGISAL